MNSARRIEFVLRNLNRNFCRLHHNHVHHHGTYLYKLQRRNFEFITHVLRGVHMSSICCTMPYSTRSPGSKYCSPRGDELFLAKLHDLLGDAEQLSTDEWENLRNDIMLSNFSVSQDNFDSITMTALLSIKRFPLAASFMDYLKEVGVKPNLVTCMKYMLFCSNHMDVCNQDVIFKTYAKIKDTVDSLPCLDISTVNCLVQGLCATDQWRKSFDYLKKLPQNCKSHNSTKDAIICAALRNNEEHLAWMIMTTWYGSLKFCGSRTYEEYFRLASRVYSNDAITADLLVAKLLTHLCRERVIIKSTAAKEIYSYFNRHKLNWKAEYMKVDNSSVCDCCRKPLEKAGLTDVEFDTLRKLFFEKSVHKSDAYINTTQSELEHFIKYVDQRKPFDIVVDGLNVAFSSSEHSYKQHALQLLNVVDRLSHTANKILILGRKHMKRWPRGIMEQIANKATMYLTSNKTEDDPFLIYAALASGPNCMFVSSDLMRDHIDRLDDHQPIDLFHQWRQTHQMFLLETDSGLDLVGPLKHNICIQGNMKSGWHIPFDDEFILEPYEVLNNWLCIQRTP